ncbi:MAG: helix-turn-helix domain-containing protein [Bifidobacteriaceae bacterium]|jgi:predicted transcriptional regulator|nr:helix-turn-helix domain-containing protein [Bifidobacteriaceae bacterium]
MAKTLDDRLAELSPERRARVEAHRERMLKEVRAYRLRELREHQRLSQANLADRIGVSQRRVSGIESGDMDKTEIGTLRRLAAQSASK